MLHRFINKVVALVCVAGFVAISGCVPETQPASQAKAPVKQANTGGEKVRCRREYPTGSHISQMVCYKVQQVDDRRESDREKMRSMQIGGAIVPQQQGN